MSELGKANERPSLSDLSIVIPFRFDTRDRLENLETVVRFFTASFDHVDIVILEEGANLRGNHLGEITGVRYHGSVNPGPFHRTRLLNLGIEQLSRRRFAAAYDTDVLLYPAAVSMALQLLRDDAPVVYPYNGQFFDVRGRLRRLLIQSATPDSLPADAVLAETGDFGRNLVCLNRNSVGGAVFYDRQAFIDCGGYHEGFVSWGFEDTELIERIEKLGYSRKRIESHPLLHLAHKRFIWRGKWYPLAGGNRSKYHELSRLSRSELQALIDAGGLRHKKQEDGRPPRRRSTWSAALNRLFSAD